MSHFVESKAENYEKQSIVEFRQSLRFFFPFGFEGRMWDLIVSVPDHCLSFYFKKWCVSFCVQYIRPYKLNVSRRNSS